MLAHSLPPFPDSVLNLTVELLLSAVDEVFGSRLRSVILYGSILFDDLAPGYGDLDFLAVIDGDLDDGDVEALVNLRRILRSGSHSMYAHMLEGAFLPSAMLDPEVPGRALWWGTSGEREWNRNELGGMALHVIRERGLVIAGSDARGDIPPSSREELLADVASFCTTAREHCRGTNLHTIDWLLSAARLLLWLREGRLVSKSEAADWGAEHARGTWRTSLPRARSLRLNPSLIDETDTQKWVAGLWEQTLAACDELERELPLSRQSADIRE